jgi:16S rRNA (uracil1498-N3)-methyltransferase
VLDGAGLECLCEVENQDRDKVQLKVLERRKAPPPLARITLMQALPKGKLFDFIVQKATELGVHRIQPLLTERVVAHLDEREGLQKAEKWRQVATEAIKQCGSAWLPRVERPLTLREVIAGNDAVDLPLVGALETGSKHPREYFSEFQRKERRPPASVSVWIGPEGDFTTSELRTIKDAGVLPITLGRLVLRTDTAALYCLSFINYELSVHP